MAMEETLFVGSATLVAVIVMDRWLPRIAGAVYWPDALMVPTTGLMDQVTAVFVLWLTCAEYCWVCPAFRLALAGPMVIVNGLKVTCAEAVFVGSAALAAITDTVVALGTALGAV